MTVWLFGDSILRGAAFDWFTAPFPDEIGFLTRPALLLARLSGRPFELYAKKLDVSHKAEKSAARIRSMVRAGSIRPGDAIVLLDVGEHSGNPAQHATNWLTVIAAAETPGLRTVVFEGFNGPKAPATCRYDLPFDGRTMNEALGLASAVVPLMEPLTKFREQLAEFGKTGFLDDDIHLDVWGQLRLCRLMLGAIGAELRGRKSLTGLITTHWAALGAPSPTGARKMAMLAME